MANIELRPIVVGVDGSDASIEATRWAAVEAALRGRAVRVVHAYSAPITAGPVEAMASAWSDETARQEADMIVAEAENAVRDAAPEVTVLSDAVPGTAAHVLIELSHNAGMVVVGHRGRGFGAWLLGSVAARVAAHAHGSVAVIRPGSADRKQRGGTILVGVDGSAAGDAALGFAFEEADLRGGSVRVVRAWEPPAPPWRVDIRPLVLDAAELETAERHRVTEWVRPWREKYPHVTVREDLTSDRPAPALVEASHRADLLVVGSRGHGGFAGLLLGSVSQQAIHHAACPVVVVR